MNIPAPDARPLWPLAVFFVSAVLIVLAILGLSFVLGQRHRERSTGEPYESGIASTGTARIRFDIKFYVVGMLFLLFDLEAVFLYAWAVSVREAGWAGFAEALVFIGVLVAALAYLWRAGALDWGKQTKGTSATETLRKLRRSYIFREVAPRHSTRTVVPHDRCSSDHESRSSDWI